MTTVNLLYYAKYFFNKAAEAQAFAKYELADLLRDIAYQYKRAAIARILNRTAALVSI